ncbi:MAG: efflux RND transporter periplasmic adaptor subunit [Terriglobales bacterium]|jgi:multidrug resistance efflux pump
MNARNKVLILLAVILAISTAYYFLSTPRGSDLVLVGTVDANQIVVSPQIQGRILKLLVDEGTQVKQGDLIAVLDPSELEAEERAAAATISSLRSQVSANEYTRRSTKGSTASDVSNAQSQLQSSRAQLAQAEATLARIESDSRRTIGLAEAGVASEQEKVQAEMNLKAQQASVQSLQEQVSAAQASLNAALARTNQAAAAASTVASTRAQMENSVAQLKEAEVRLGYTKIYAPVTGTVLVRAAREGEVVMAGQAIVTVVDFSDTWVRAPIPETEADHIGFGDTLKIRLPGGSEVSGKVFYKAAEADFATQRDVNRRKRDIHTLLLKVRLDNPKGAYVPGMTAEVLVPPALLKSDAGVKSAEAAGKP